jgi:hypothetical protein
MPLARELIDWCDHIELGAPEKIKPKSRPDHSAADAIVSRKGFSAFGQKGVLIRLTLFTNQLTINQHKCEQEESIGCLGRGV